MLPVQFVRPDLRARLDRPVVAVKRGKLARVARVVLLVRSARPALKENARERTELRALPAKKENLELLVLLGLSDLLVKRAKPRSCWTSRACRTYW